MKNDDRLAIDVNNYLIPLLLMHINIIITHELIIS